MRKDFKTGGRVGLSRGGGSAPCLRGSSGSSNIKAPRGGAGGRVKYQEGGFSANDLLILKRHKYKPSEVARWKDKGKDLIKVLKTPNP